jgi:hypothetical protein
MSFPDGTCDMNDELDFIAVSCVAHELTAAHGRDGWRHAGKSATAALTEGKDEESQFCKAVEACLKPRSNSSV